MWLKLPTTRIYEGLQKVVGIQAKLFLLIENLLLMKTSMLLSTLQMFLPSLDRKMASRMKYYVIVLILRKTSKWSLKQENPREKVAAFSSSPKTKSSS
jgi:hypothetical protein